ncbi:DUF5675 family protein [Spirosoma sp.]|uniref:DUF5675 family protein n=1 Tax=Spirosoma sp. TaxID=1899569 RepID=UPI0026274C00|nr:DUF5675 family protein [Spirosoma sp.]MCX6216232.1 DUF5675 family protein [Spirosoma sp.]
MEFDFIPNQYTENSIPSGGIFPERSEYPHSDIIDDTLTTNISKQLHIEIIRLDNRYYPVKGRKNDPNERRSRVTGVLLVNGRVVTDTIEDYDYGWDDHTAEAEMFYFKGRDEGKIKYLGVKDIRTNISYTGRASIPTGEYYITFGGGKFGPDALMVSKNGKDDRLPGFNGVRIHAGHHSGYSVGCILVGMSRNLAENQLETIDTLPFDKEKLKDKKTGKIKGNSTWSADWLKDLLRSHNNWARLTIRRNYSADLCSIKEPDEESLDSLKKYRNNILIQHNLDLDITVNKNQFVTPPALNPFKPMPHAKPGGKR